MKSKTLLMASAISLLLGMTSCKSASTLESSPSVAYTVADHYFVRNDVRDYSPRKLTTQAELDSLLGMATVMSTDGSGLPTHIDFSRQCALAVMTPETRYDTDIQPVSLKKENGHTTLTYRVVTMGDERSSSIVPLMLLIVDKDDARDVRFVAAH